jgi:pSer/pThr/pTyr-binding forkhead associated (FHA) protein
VECNHVPSDILAGKTISQLYMATGEPVELKDGDLIRFGTDTEVAVEV